MTHFIRKRYIIEEKLSQNADKYQSVPVKKFVELVGARSALPVEFF